ncbi:hypothetical protein K504DRAFT_507777 [Pleomassaria siparia CBS 279.74]|uniref:Uncharacterized protein n=1 Tax=Pleomassaria siparia CBS 279.74 TaxID=1314801 RepID=A0A6G1JTE2_9PLEO|nr:hypothetical protein K504DRAFT_507777 [Pleomassaria siparia CBS 279.74]
MSLISTLSTNVAQHKHSSTAPHPESVEKTRRRISPATTLEKALPAHSSNLALPIPSMPT